MRMRVPALLLGLLLCGLLLHGAPAVEAAPKKVKLDKKKILDLGLRWFKARPKTQFDRWDRPTRKKLLEEAAAFGAVPEGSRDAVVEILWKAVKKHGPKGKGKMPTPYGEAEWIQNGAGRRRSGLVLGLHGGGPGSGSAGSATGWKLPGHMGMYPQGIELVHDTWNSVHGERFILTLIEIAKAQYDVDENRVYSMGFSMGGNGSMFMAGRHPDLLAGAIPAHGVVAAKGGSKVVEEKDVGALEHGLLPNMRNLAVYFYTGTKDVNCEPGTFCKSWTQIQELRKTDRAGWADIRFKCHAGIAHSQPPGEPGNAYKFIKDKRRNPYPDKILWEYNDAPWPFRVDTDKTTRRTKHWMYWLHCLDPRDRMLVTATRAETEKEHVIDLVIPKSTFPDDFTVYLNERMYDVKKEVVVNVGGKEVYRGRPEPTLATILESLDARLDRTLTFDRKVRIPERE